GGGERPAAGDALRQGVARDQPHGDEGAALDLAGVVDRHDPRMHQAPGGDRLAAEALQGAGAGEVALVEDLERHLTVQVELGRAVDDGLAAAPDLRLDPVPAELLARDEPHRDPSSRGGEPGPRRSWTRLTLDGF